jgi:beta-glucosidase
MDIFECIRSLEHPPLIKHSREQIDELVTDLMSRMTLREKIGQLFQTAPKEAHVEGLRCHLDQETDELIREGLCGSIIGVSVPEIAYQLQRLAVEESRLGIPLFFAMDIIHGCRTIFPINLAMSCSFDPDWIEKTCNVAAREAAHKCIHLTYSPMVDIVRDPRWGRVMESNGEDPYLSRVLAGAYIRGYQQGDLTSYDSVAACVKHFAAYGAVEAGREYNTVDMSDRHLRMFYLPPYRACVDEGAACVMSSFNIVNGVPSTANSYLLQQILRQEWGFEGFVVSDYTSTEEIINHKIASNPEIVAEKCIKAGLDHEMISNTYISHLEKLVEKGRVSVDLIDAACRRILSFKYEIGLFDNPYRAIYADPESYVCHPESRKISLEMAKRSIVLLKNKNNILPLKDKNKKIALIGPGADSRSMVGAWGGFGRVEECVTLREGLSAEGLNLVYAKGCSFLGDDEDDASIEEAVKAASQADIILFALGEPDHFSGECNSRSDISVTGRQKELVEKLLPLDKPMVGIFFSGRPLDLVWFDHHLDGVVQAWYLGNESGNALAHVLTGKYNPSAKLTMTFPYTAGQIPVYYNHFNTGRPSMTGQPRDIFKSCYIDIPSEPLYPFGYGLSYTTFSFGPVFLSASTMSGSDSVTAEVLVANQGSCFGEEIVQLYIECMEFSVTRPVKELKGFQKISLAPGEERRVTFTLTCEDLCYLNIDNRMTPEDTEYKVYIGPDSRTQNYQILKTRGYV